MLFEFDMRYINVVFHQIIVLICSEFLMFLSTRKRIFFSRLKFQRIKLIMDLNPPSMAKAFLLYFYVA